MAEILIKAKVVKNYHAEKTVKLTRKRAIRVKNKIDGAGFVQATSETLDGELEEDVFRIVVYHRDLKTIIDKISKDDTKWLIKE